MSRCPSPCSDQRSSLVIDALAQQLGFAVAIAQEECVTLGGNRQAPELPLLFRLRIEVVAFDLEDRLFDCFAVVRIEPIEQRNDFVHLRPGQRADRLASVVGLIRATRARDEATFLARDDRHGVGVFHRVRAAAIGDQPLQQREQQMAAAGNERG